MNMLSKQKRSNKAVASKSAAHLNCDAGEDLLRRALLSPPTSNRILLRIRDILKYLFKRFIEYLGNSKGHLQRRGILAPLDGVHRLPGYANLFGQRLLRHLAVMEPQGSDCILNPEI
jgi:hypothetical protein